MYSSSFAFFPLTLFPAFYHFRHSTPVLACPFTLLLHSVTKQERCYESEVADGHDERGRPIRQNNRLGRVRKEITRGGECVAARVRVGLKL